MCDSRHVIVMLYIKMSYETIINRIPLAVGVLTFLNIIELISIYWGAIQYTWIHNKYTWFENMDSSSSSTLKVLAAFMPVILEEIIFILRKRSDQSSISLWWTKLIQDIHNISQHIILISTASAFYGQFKVLAAFMPVILEEIIFLLGKCSDQS